MGVLGHRAPGMLCSPQQGPQVARRRPWVCATPGLARGPPVWPLKALELHPASSSWLSAQGLPLSAKGQLAGGSRLMVISAAAATFQHRPDTEPDIKCPAGPTPPPSRRPHERGLLPAPLNSWGNGGSERYQPAGAVNPRHACWPNRTLGGRREGQGSHSSPAASSP